MSDSVFQIDQEIHEYFKYLTLGNYQKSTVKMYCRTLQKFLEFCETRFRAEALAQAHTQVYLLSRIESVKVWSRINADYSTIQHCGSTTRQLKNTVGRFVRYQS